MAFELGLNRYPGSEGRARRGGHFRALQNWKLRSHSDPQYYWQQVYSSSYCPISGQAPHPLSSEQWGWLKTEDSAFFRETLSASRWAHVSEGKGALLWCDNATAGEPSESCLAKGVIVLCGNQDLCPWPVSATVCFGTRQLSVITAHRVLRPADFANTYFKGGGFFPSIIYIILMWCKRQIYGLCLAIPSPYSYSWQTVLTNLDTLSRPHAWTTVSQYP